MGDVSAYYNGEWIPSSELRVSVDDAGFLLGATVTERMRTFGGQAFRLNEHLARLRHSLEVVGMDVDAIGIQIAEAVPEFIRRNQSLIDSGDDWSIVVFVTPGTGGSAPRRYASTVIRCRFSRGLRNTKRAYQ